MDKTDRTERLLALILLGQMKSSPQSEKILHLNIAGFSNVEIADILQMTPASVAQRLYEARRGTKARTGKRPGKGSRKRA